MTEKRFDIQFDTVRYFLVVDVPNERCVGRFDTMADAKGYLELYEFYIELQEENEQLKQQIKDMLRFEHTGEHIRLSINIETGELQRHIYATGQWFGDFDRILVTNWLDEKTYQKFIDRVIEVYNTEFKGDME